MSEPVAPTAVEPLPAAPPWEKGVVLTASELEGIAPAADWSRWITAGRAPSAVPEATDANPQAEPAAAPAVGESFNEDLEQLAGLGISAIALTLEWARFEPRPGAIDGAAVERRLDQLRAARARGLRVWGVLVDGTLPGWFADDEGGFADDRARGLLWPRHVDWVGETFGGVVDGWIPQREPIHWALRRFLRGEAPPGRRDMKATAEAVRAAVLADGEAWRLLRGTAPVAMYQTGRTIVAKADDVKARPLAAGLERLLWHPWLRALAEGELVVGDLPSREVPHLRGAFDRVVVELRPALEVDGTGTWRPYPPEATVGPSGWAAWPEGMGEALRRVTDALGSHQIVAAGSLADVADDGRAQPDHLTAVFDLVGEATRDSSVVGWWQSSPIDGYHWNRGFTLHPGLIDTHRRERTAAHTFRSYWG